MKRSYQIFITVLMSMFLFACFDNTEKVKSDLAKLDETIENSSNLVAISQLQETLMSSTSAEDRAATFTKIATEYQSIKESLSTVQFNTAEVNQLKREYLSGFEDFIELMKQSAHYSLTSPTEEQLQQLQEIQKNSVGKLTLATENLEKLKARIAEKQK